MTSYHGLSGIYKKGCVVYVRFFGNTRIRPDKAKRAFPTAEQAEDFYNWATEQADSENLSLGGFMTGGAF
ncbi:MAG: hypothetical protein EOM03_11245 [Clostridia bacterium]|nr:hypothetical protein [Clostridia bacterium]